MCCEVVGTCVEIDLSHPRFPLFPCGHGALSLPVAFLVCPQKCYSIALGQFALVGHAISWFSLAARSLAWGPDIGETSLFSSLQNYFHFHCLFHDVPILI